MSGRAVIDIEDEGGYLLPKKHMPLERKVGLVFPVAIPGGPEIAIPLGIVLLLIVAYVAYQIWQGYQDLE